MPRLTFWESLIKLSGPALSDEVSVAAAVENSAVSAGIAEVQIKRLLQERLIEVVDDDTIRLTEKGRSTVDGMHGSQYFIGP